MTEQLTIKCFTLFTFSTHREVCVPHILRTLSVLTHFVYSNTANYSRPHIILFYLDHYTGEKYDLLMHEKKHKIMIDILIRVNSIYM